MTHNFPYLKDSSFLRRFDQMKLKQQFVKIIVLTFDERPIEEIQGRVISGSFNIDGASAMRRTANLTLIADQYQNDLTDTKHLLSINKKVEILVGFTNTTGEYTECPMIWFPQGVYVIMSPNISNSQSGVSISLTLHDKMALLNGECGGTFPASVVFNQVQDIDQDGNIQITQPTIYQIIQQLVNHFGGEQLGKIIISDVDSKIKKVMKWTGDTPLYLYQEPAANGTYNSFSTNYGQLVVKQATGHGKIFEFSYGQDIGYILSDFTYPDQLVGNAGDNVCTILDQIKSLLGNYQYFYDIDGNFRFQQVKNYLNTSYSTVVLEQMKQDNYLVDFSDGKSVYTFNNANIIQSFSNSPQYQQIKNDFVVWGTRKTIDDQQIPIRYHLAIDKRPQPGNSYRVFFFVDPDDGIRKAKIPVAFPKQADFPKKGQVGQYYYDESTKTIYQWDAEGKRYKWTNYKLETVKSTDFRTQLYLSGVASQPFGLQSNYYYTQLKNEWPKLYDVQLGKFLDEVTAEPSAVDFFLDLIDTKGAIMEFSVQNIGRRTSVISDDNINCIFQPDNPDIVLIQAGSQDADELQQQCIDRDQQYAQVTSSIYNMLLNGGSLRSAYEQIKAELYQYTNYNEQISLTALPIYYLQPNTRITVRDAASGINGDFMIQSISLPLDVSGTMTITCTKALERI